MALRGGPRSIRSVTVPTDFSAGAEAALRRALALPLAKGATLRLIHVLPRRLSKKARSASRHDARAAGERLLSRVKGELKDSRAIRLELDILEGRAFVEIVRDARITSTDLLVVGRHGSRRVSDLLIGTVANQVARTSHVPVLIVNRVAERAYGRPLVAVDLDGASDALLRAVQRLLGASSPTIRVVYAYDVFESLLAPSWPDEGESEYRRECRRKAQAKLDAFLGRGEIAHLRCEGVVLPGDPRPAILSEAVRHRVDLIAVGTHGRSGIAHALLGSVAEWVVSTSPCDVLVVRPRRLTFELP